MASSTRPPANAFVAVARRVYNPIGFKEGYKFLLWSIFAGTLFTFALRSLRYLDFWGVFCNPSRPRGTGAMPGECFYYTKPGRIQLGLLLHLYTILPAGLLACFQFIPIQRRWSRLVHRVNGYFVLVLAFVGTASAFLMVRHSAGGGIDVQSGIGALGVIFIFSLTRAWINIRRSRIQKHRVWMIRAWVYGGAVITTRMILFPIVLLMSHLGGFYAAQPCDKISHTIRSQETAIALYPQCATFFSGENMDQHAVVRATFFGNVMEITAAFNMSFGPAVWMSFVMHLIGAELYLSKS